MSLPGLDRHIDFLGRLHLVWALLNAVVACGMTCFAAAAGVLAMTARHTRPGSEIAAVLTAAIFLVLAISAALWAAVHWRCGHALIRHDRVGRLLALALAIGNSMLIPLVTLLAGYTLWVLLREEARGRFEAGGQHEAVVTADQRSLPVSTVRSAQSGER
jgi:hypothetical protein